MLNEKPEEMTMVAARVLDRRFTELGENKDTLTPEEHAELLAWVAFTQERSLEKLGAEAALQRLFSLCPDLGSPP